ncbi:DUF2061 domain-containing protein [Flavobacterium rakeshii]|uniref:DUF2061 domain-containing protein n=1 Tax=Flavobacterium rakeshii TaxID=1038845 RepID=A0A6N8HEJ3_9FLAO|nr:DUF2061 domain-containing protein [Flavobacterium rakeshii]MEE1896825.1 DUF2061 domain-containing protein [Flavobacterium rakeshii]MUV03648.1 DUF2061 domain-containing protein [Flavobacterium rakeshii]
MLDLIKAKKSFSLKDSPKISAIKAVTWRIVGTIDTMIISYILTGNITIAFSIGSVEVMSKMFLYFLHERAWARLTRKNSDNGEVKVSE